MVEFQKLSIAKLEKIRQELIVFFYKKAKVNIAVEDSINKRKYKSFRNNVKKTLKKQITPYTKQKRIDEIVSGIQKFKKRDLILIIAASFLVFESAFPGEEDGIKEFLQWAVVIGALDALSKLGILSPSFDSSGDETQQIIDDRFSFLTGQLDQTTMSWIARNIEIGIKQEMSSAEIAQMISENMGSEIDRRSNMIAETELVNMLGAITILIFSKNGISRVKWITVGDERTCSICMGNEGDGWIPVGDSFSSGASHPPAHISCRCYLEPQTKIDGKIWRG